MMNWEFVQLCACNQYLFVGEYYDRFNIPHNFIGSIARWNKETLMFKLQERQKGLVIREGHFHISSIKFYNKVNYE